MSTFERKTSVIAQQTLYFHRLQNLKNKGNYYACILPLCIVVEEAVWHFALN